MLELQKLDGSHYSIFTNFFERRYNDVGNVDRSERGRTNILVSGSKGHSAVRLTTGVTERHQNRRSKMLLFWVHDRCF